MNFPPNQFRCLLFTNVGRVLFLFVENIDHITIVETWGFLLSWGKQDTLFFLFVLNSGFCSADMRSVIETMELRWNVNERGCSTHHKAHTSRFTNSHFRLLPGFQRTALYMLNIVAYPVFRIAILNLTLRECSQLTHWIASCCDSDPLIVIQQCKHRDPWQSAIAQQSNRYVSDSSAALI